MSDQTTDDDKVITGDGLKNRTEFGNPNPEPEAIVDQPDDPRTLLRQARAMVPVGNFGVKPVDFAQQVQWANDMAKAKFALPDFLRQNVGDCLAIIDISSRVNLSPYMVAQQTYTQNNRLCFSSQLFHAFAQASGLLRGDLTVEYEGEGDDMICIVTGYLKSDPVPRVHRSQRYADMHPGYTLKREVAGDDGGGSAKSRISYAEGQRRKAAGEIAEGSKLFPLGSPLWDRKPKVQLFYDTSRDWVRIYAPRATLGVYTGEELEEYGPDFARDVTPRTPDAEALHQRLAASKTKADREGYHPDAVDRALSSGKKRTAHKAPPKGREARTAAPAKSKGQTPAKEAAKPAPAASRPAKPRNVEQYGEWLKHWLPLETTRARVKATWDAERKLRNECGMTQEDRKPFEALVAKRIAQLKS